LSGSDPENPQTQNDLEKNLTEELKGLKEENQALQELIEDSNRAHSGIQINTNSEN
jgi:hypothetical protein